MIDNGPDARMPRPMIDDVPHLRGADEHPPVVQRFGSSDRTRFRCLPKNKID